MISFSYTVLARSEKRYPPPIIFDQNKKKISFSYTKSIISLSPSSNTNENPGKPINIEVRKINPCQARDLNSVSSFQIPISLFLKRVICYFWCLPFEFTNKVSNFQHKDQIWGLGLSLFSMNGSSPSLL